MRFMKISFSSLVVSFSVIELSLSIFENGFHPAFWRASGSPFAPSSHVDFLRRCLQSVYALRSGSFALTVFFLFFSTSSLLADPGKRFDHQKFAETCRTAATKLASDFKQKVSEIDYKKAAHATAKLPFQFAWATAKGGVYPLWFLGKGSWEYFRSEKEGRIDALKEVLGNRKEKDKLAMVIGGILWGLQQTTGLTVNQYHALTSDFDEDDGEGIIVIIDNFGDDPLYDGSGDYVYNRLYKPKYGGRVFLLKNIPFEKIPAELKKLAQQHGPIAKVDYYGHGLVGRTIGTGGGSPSASVSRSGGYPGQPISPRPGEMPLPLDPDGWDRDIFETKLEKGILAKNAKIRFNSCFIGNGPEGDLFGRAVANSWLREGGTVYTSNVQVFPSIGEMAGLKANLFIPPQWIRTIADQLVPARGAVTAYTLLHEIPTYVHNSERVDGPYFLPSQKVRRHSTTGESPLRDEFEKAWASGFDYNRIHYVYDAGDIRHYSPLRASAPAGIEQLLVREEEKAGNGNDIPYSIKLVFANREDAEKYVQNLDLDRTLLEAPQFVEGGVVLRTKPEMKDEIKKREYQQQISYAEKAKERLKNVYEKSLASDKETAERLYDEYRNMLPLYVFPRFMSNDLPKDPELYEALERLKRR